MWTFRRGQLSGAEDRLPPLAAPPSPAGVATNNLVLPKLRQLPERAVVLQATRQQLLGQVIVGWAWLRLLWPADAAHRHCTGFDILSGLRGPVFTCYLVQHVALESRVNELVEGAGEQGDGAEGLGMVPGCSAHLRHRPG